MINALEKEIRRKEVEKAIAYNSVDGIPPSDVLKELFNRYIEGDLNIDQVKSMLQDHYIELSQEKNKESIRTLRLKTISL